MFEEEEKNHETGFCGLSLEGPNNWVVASTHFDLVYFRNDHVSAHVG
jgi:hypothetical protein